jgi:hypothetical protein
MAKMLGLDANDEMVRLWLKGTDGNFISKENINDYPLDIPLAFRSMSKRKVIKKCWNEGRDFYYIDNGYIGNAQKKKWYYRVVKNNVQHVDKIVNVPSDRFKSMTQMHPWMIYKGQKNRPENGPILLVTPSEKPGAFYGVTRDEWLNETTETLRQYTDRKIIVRDKGLRGDRIGDNSIAAQCSREGIWAVVTYQSIAALEAIHYGIPAFTCAPTATQHLANTDLSKIESPMYPNETEFQKLLNYLTYCQYTPNELGNGTAYRLIEELGL